MIVFPAIDLVAGKVVRLERGDRAHMKVYSDDPVAQAHEFLEQGATWVHVVDLSAALEEDDDARAANSAAIEAICRIDGLSVDVGGGVRSLARIDELAGYGARRIALGTVLVTEPGFAEIAARGFGDLLAADVAARDGQVKINGWREGISRSVEDVVGELSGLGFKHLVFTDIATACRPASTWRPTAASPDARAFPWWRRAASPRWTTFARALPRMRASSRAASSDAPCTRRPSRWPRHSPR